MIKLMICGLKPEKAWPAHEVGRPESKRFLLDIVANKRNGLDVDKFDYFVRDSICAMGAPPIQCDIQRIIRSSRIINVDNQNQICYEEKMALQLIDLFKLRAWLHKFVYQHHTVNCIEEMICDALRSADEPFMSLGFLNCDASRLSEAVDDVEAFSRMGDWLLNAIEASSAPTLAESRDVLFRLRQRSLYLSVAVPTDLGHEHLRTKTEQEILSEILTLLPTDANKEHCKRDLLVHFTSIDFGSRDERGRANNPIHKIRFYNPKINADVGFQLKRRMPDMLMPRAFSEKLLYVYSRSDESFDMLDAAYRRWRDMIHRRVERFEATAAPPQTPPTSDSMLTPVATGNQPSPMRHAIRLRRTQSRQQATSSVALRKFNST
ncbi:uncharacterized protein MONBRDRAFT_4902 [Monosiga brevicollis MX1]|uniref:Uncharacterized protein n=1 Tax=Monosiga brevicollis TaxID=81824 RepID=A9UPA4_MONBE|nr:uncharacterized protein MONBRDRAFT_4902 [Monosiga brevicollis MX1]EDQ92384.1 predicted protein [Monosiga brevicollis MX1]|eukprot:XP_001742146.1 hypothetical protein [Monosiga brevicollis MX1]